MALTRYLWPNLAFIWLSLAFLWILVLDVFIRALYMILRAWYCIPEAWLCCRIVRAFCRQWVASRYWWAMIGYIGFWGCSGALEILVECFRCDDLSWNFFRVKLPRTYPKSFLHIKSEVQPLKLLAKVTYELVNKKNPGLNTYLFR